MSVFKIEADPTFPAKVKIGKPGGGTQELSVVFRHKTREELQDYFDRNQKEKRSDVDAALEIIESWSADKELSADSLKTLFSNFHDAARAIFVTYADELAQARAGN